MAGSGRLGYLTIGALGIVYGDIGTSPLYAFRECFSEASGVVASAANVLGVLSLVFWSLILVISIKYVGFVLKADNRGEGGILAMMTLVTDAAEARQGVRSLLIVFGLIGSAFIYADAMITPAISVLSAVEGLGSIAPGLGGYVAPVALAILVGLYLVQSRGTEQISRIFGPVMVVWFAVLGVLGLLSTLDNPAVIAAVDPRHALAFFAANGFLGFALLGTVFLVITGGEALYADMGHFGRTPIRVAWFGIVLPGLLLNYFGQGALLLREPGFEGSLFYALTPAWGVVPMVVLATFATVIASQAVISGAFSLTAQAIQLGLSPRLRIVQTSSEVIGQVYLPAVNWAFMVGTVVLVVEFGSSSALASAYGLAVAAAMMLTTFFLYVVARRVWGWGRLASALFAVPFIVLHTAFFAATLLKVPSGGWVPLGVAAVIYVGMVTWDRGRRYLSAALESESLPLQMFLDSLASDGTTRVAGTAVFLTREPDVVPRTLLHNLKHNKVLHERVVLLTVVTERVPTVPEAERGTVSPLGAGFFRVVLRYGYDQRPNVPVALARAAAPYLSVDLMETTYFLGRETLIISRRPRLAMSTWRRALFAYLQHNALDAARFFGIPPNRVIELGAQLEI